tara:strand:- start:379 stop:534 length:156 start_codon:yes stop_codon:yes gene_type:complete
MGLGSRSDSCFSTVREFENNKNVLRNLEEKSNYKTVIFYKTTMSQLAISKG